MKDIRIFYCVIIFLQAFTTVAQNDSLTKWRKSVSIDFSISGRNYDPNFSATYCLENKKNHFSLGPLFALRNGQTELHLVGVKFGYAFYPGDRQKVVDFYFDYDFLLQRLIVVEGFYINNWLTPKENVLTFFENYIGYGFKIKTFHHLYVTQGAGFGYVFVHSKYPNGEDKYSGSQHDDIAAGIIKIGLEYYFN